MKGLPIAALAQGTNVQVWFSSPTGDSLDSFQMNLPTHTADQAISLANAYSEMINKVLYAVPADTLETLDSLRQEIRELRNWEEAHIAEITELKEKLEMYKFAYDSQRMVITDLKEKLYNYQNCLTSGTIPFEAI